MSDDKDPVGSVAEEAVKLLGALQDWTRDTGHDSGGAAAGAASAFKNLNEHMSTGGQDCKYCPVCQLISVLRQTSPEVKHHLSTAASSLLHAAAAALSTDVAGRRSQAPVEKIDLIDDAWDEE